MFSKFFFGLRLLSGGLLLFSQVHTLERQLGLTISTYIDMIRLSLFDDVVDSPHVVETII